MLFSLLVRKFTVGLSLVVALPVLAAGQSGPEGGEYPIVGNLPGNQGQPGVSINSGGGYVVWQDQNTFGNRLTIMARPLDSGLNSSNLASFRVNSSAKGDHENPHVALLKNGGAVFVWQGAALLVMEVFVADASHWEGKKIRCGPKPWRKT